MDLQGADLVNSWTIGRANSTSGPLIFCSSNMPWTFWSTEATLSCTKWSNSTGGCPTKCSLLPRRHSKLASMRLSKYNYFVWAHLQAKFFKVLESARTAHRTSSQRCWVSVCLVQQFSAVISHGRAANSQNNSNENKNEEGGKQERSSYGVIV